MHIALSVLGFDKPLENFFLFLRERVFFVVQFEVFLHSHILELGPRDILDYSFVRYGHEALYHWLFRLLRPWLSSRRFLGCLWLLSLLRLLTSLELLLHLLADLLVELFSFVSLVLFLLVLLLCLMHEVVEIF